MKLHHGGPIEYIGSKYRRSIPENITRVRAKNQAKSSMSALSRGRPTPFGQFKTRVVRLEYLDTSVCTQCPSLRKAKELAKLFLERVVFRYKNKWFVMCI